MRTDPRFTFFLGYLFGRQRRRRAGVGCLLIGLGLLVGCSAVLTLVSAPLSWLRARTIAALPQPAPAELTSLAPGAHIIVTAQLPPDLPADDSGLAVFYVEVNTVTPSGAGTPATPTATHWQRILPPPRRVGMMLPNAHPLLVQLPPEINFLNAQQVALDGKTPDESERRAVGYVAGQVLTMQGTWEGNSLFTASELYAGGPNEYLAYWQQMPGLGLAVGLVCGGVALFLLISGMLLRLVGA